MAQVILKLEQKQPVYIAKKFDKVDEYLSRFINSQPQREQMKIMFLREQEGVYQFGSQRVFVKINKNNQLQVRTGGGYISVEEFIEKMTPGEIEKSRRKDAVNKS